MSAPAFQERLRRVLADGGLRVADLARWLDRDHATISGWTKGVTPTAAPGVLNALINRLAQLEIAISERKLPLPAYVAKDRRLRYLARLKGQMARRAKRVVANHDAEVKESVR